MLRKGRKFMALAERTIETCWFRTTHYVSETTGFELLRPIIDWVGGAGQHDDSDDGSGEGGDQNSHSSLRIEDGEFVTLEGQTGDEEGHGEADASEHRNGHDLAPVDAARQRADTRSHRYPGGYGYADCLPKDKPEDDAECDSR